MTSKRPKGVTFIGYFYVFGSIILLFSLILGTEQSIPMGLRFGVPNVPENIITPFVAILSLVISYGYLTLKKWGYWLMLLYSVIFLLISISLVAEYNTQPFIGNTIWSVIVAIYTYRQKNIFLH